MSQPLKVIDNIPMTQTMLVSTSVPENDHPVWSAATTYALGARVILTTTNRIYQSLQANNTNQPPVTSPVFWAEVSPTNRWRMFDLSNTTKTQTGTAAHYEIRPGLAVGALALLNIQGVISVRVRLTDPVQGVVFDRTFGELSFIPRESSWFAWFFGERRSQSTLFVHGLPSYPDAVLRMDVTGTADAAIGSCIFGTLSSIGMAVQHGVRLGIQDYSRKERNDWGDTVLVRRAFAARASFQVMLPNSDLDNTYRLLAELRATPCVWIGSDGLGSLTIFGFYNNFEIGITYADYSDCTIDIEGLT